MPEDSAQPQIGGSIQPDCSTARRALQHLVDTYKAYARDEIRNLEEARMRLEAYQRAASDAESELDKLPKQVP